MKQVYLWLSIIAAIILVATLQNRYKHVYVRQAHYEQQPLVHQFNAVLEATNSTVPTTAYHDSTQPLFKELAYSIHTARSRNTPLSIINSGTQSSFLLKQALPHLDAEKITSWNVLPATTKHLLFNNAFKQALKNTDAVKEALKIIIKDKTLREFIENITSFTDKEYLTTLLTGPQASLAHRIFTNHNSLNQQLLIQLTRANLTLATLPILNTLADQYSTLDEYFIIANGRRWTPMTLWFAQSSRLDPSLLKHALRRIHTLYNLRSWLRSPHINQKWFTPWYFLPTPIDKFFPQKDAPFTIEHLNSAQLLDTGTLYFRNEEFLKNIIHELLHGLSLEHGINKEQASKLLTNSYAIKRIDNGPVLLTEALIEGLTHIIHTIYTASEQPGGTFEGRLTNLWSLEKSFAFYQSAKMIYTSELETLEEFLNPESTEKRITQTTAAVEYHLLKTALIHTPEKLLRIMINPRNKQQKLLTLLKKNFADPQFSQEINRFLNWLKKGNNLAPLFTTGRLTVVD